MELDPNLPINNTKQRVQITEEAQKKFRYKGKKVSVYVETEHDLSMLSYYLKMDLDTYAKSYLMSNHSVPCVLNCDYRISLAINTKGDMSDMFAKMFGSVGVGGGDTYQELKRKAIPLNAFLDLENNPEYLI